MMTTMLDGRASRENLIAAYFYGVLPKTLLLLESGGIFAIHTMTPEKADAFPFEITHVSLKDAGRLGNGFTGQGYAKHFIRVGPRGFFVSNEIEPLLPKIYSMELRPDDVFVITFAKSGTTWVQELVWLIENDFDFKTAKTVLLDQRFPFLTPLTSNDVGKKIMERASQEKKELTPIASYLGESGLVRIASWPSPRFIKNHLPMSLLPPDLLEKTKVVYVARDPRDVAVSYFHYHRFMAPQGFVGEFKDFWKLFRNGLVEYSPYFAHFREAWNLKNHPNMLFLFYEELSQDLPKVIQRVTKFFDKTASEQQIAELCEHLRFENFKKNKAVNKDELKQLGIIDKGANFIRTGKVGEWRDYFDDEMKKDAERWMKEGLRGIDYKFPK